MGDANPMVVANAVAALTEIGDGDASTSASTSPGGGLDLAPAARAKLLRALNECTEWGQVFILDALGSSSRAFSDAADAEAVAEMAAETEDATVAPTPAEDPLFEDHVARLGGELFGRHLVAVEAAGVLLFVALVGAIAVVTRGEAAALAEGRPTR